MNKINKNNPIATFIFEEPIVYVNFTGNEFTDESFKEYATQSKKVFDWKRYGMIYNISKVEFVEEKYRTLQAYEIEENKKQIEEKAVGLAIIARSFFKRTFAKTVFLFLNYPSKVKICKDEEEAIEWINELLTKEKI